VFDMVRRWLRASGYKVTYVRNITDIDDKIIKRAAEKNEPVEAVTARFIQAMDEDAAALGVEKPDHEPRATQYVPQMQTLISELQQKNLAYQASSGDVCYAVRRFPGYGKLSGKSLDELRAGERVDVNYTKEDPLDFVLWKRAKPDEPKWPSPWGDGRPGWHIECSAMSCTLLGEQFDIHGGGMDLQFPHHENEIAQSEGATGKPFVKYWMHNEFIRVQDEKMSKSLGNFFVLRDVLKHYRAEVVRFFILRAHYRSPVNYTDVNLEDAHASLTRLYTALRDVPVKDASVDWADPHAIRFKEAMDDDFGTPEAIAELFKLANQVFHGDVNAARQLKSLGGLLGLLQADPVAFLQKRPRVIEAQGTSAGTSRAVAEGDLKLPGFEKSVKELIEERKEARKRKDFKEADRIRKELDDHGVVLEDKGSETNWRMK
jgi:cysteinyl-tRNA synthetase